MSQWLTIAICALLVGFATPTFAQQQQQSVGPTYVYTARTAEPVRRQGEVTAAGITWSCQDRACTISGPWPRPLMPGCRALAAEIGPIIYFGREGAVFNAANIAICNAGTARLPPADRRVIRDPNVIRPPGTEPAPGPVSAPANGPVTITAPEIAFIGGGSVDTADRGAVAVTINTPEIAFVGGIGIDASDRAAPPVAITTPEIAFIGQ